MTPIVLEFAKNSGLTGRILEVGSYNVNGSLRQVLPITLGTDMREGPDVDQVVNACDLEKTFGPESWENVASADAFEHMKDWRGALRNMWSVLKPGGKLLLTTVTPKKGRHAFPDDYWRFERPQFEAIFGDNLKKLEIKSAAIMAVAVKNGPLGDLDQINPYKVP